ncbi:LacI family DNA-binding transcriptional regulator [Paremcibacter congregatus]|uniref:LacI family transcriptional regulator n=1 Tax=Paremcibacter congregatus TaxID=2043170 RepID=A0A2G4YY78_9PROT|nr:LacI family DNA-binding transcriptional regulator [Paremcibacter congregatus]PHZ86396.1 LacI family transcriptional regulator [Paremcibacter congregatus]QDE28509.1 LacI family transcriptional regulator [Paremcibacter congregatus]
MTEHKTLTMSDIARLAGVSESTVSRALRDNPIINEKTRKKVQQIARDHHYQINESARNLRLNKSHTIAVVMLLDPACGQAISDPFLLDLLGNVADELTKNGYDLLLSTTQVLGEDLSPRYLDSKRADGMIIIGQGAQGQQIDALAGSRKLFVVWGADRPGQNYATVGSDNKKGAYLAVRHLIETGRRRIAFLGDSRHPEIEQRLAGYHQALAEAGLNPDPTLQVETDFSSQSGYEATRDILMTEGRSFDAIFTVSDAIAMGAIKLLGEKGVRVPEEVAVSGFDDIPTSAYCTPSLTTVRQNTAEGGRQLVKCLLDQLAGKEQRSVVLDVELIVRQSSSGESA